MTTEIKLTRGYVAIIDKENYELLSKYKWYPRRGGHTVYAETVINGKTVSMHRLLMDAPSGQQVDHKDGNGLNNSKSNLRLCTAAENRLNCRPRKSLANFKGVFRCSKGKLWRAKIGRDRVTIFLGYFKTAEEAAKMYDAAAVALHGEFARLNFPQLSEAA